MEFEERYPQISGVVGIVEKLLGPAKYVATFVVGIYAGKKGPEIVDHYLDGFAERVARKNTQIAATQAQQPQQYHQTVLDPEKVYKGLETIMGKQENLESRVDTLESKPKPKNNGHTN